MSEALTADEVITHLGLKPHPEGGWYRETFRDERGHAGRAHSTAILYLLKAGEVGRWHRVDAAEVWHWYGGPFCSRSRRATRAANTGLGRTYLPASIRKRSFRQAPGRRRGAWVPGRLRALPWRQASTLPASRSPRKAGSPEAQSMNWPPLMVSVEPVIQAASSAARNTTQRATSSASPSRPTGICPTIAFITSSDTPDRRSVAT
jgi:Cupin superfamily (DUF985)